MPSRMDRLVPKPMARAKWQRARDTALHLYSASVWPRAANHSRDILFLGSSLPDLVFLRGLRVLCGERFFNAPDNRDPDENSRAAWPSIKVGAATETEVKERNARRGAYLILGAPPLTIEFRPN